MHLDFDVSATFYHGTIDIYGKLIEEKGIIIFNDTLVGLDFGAGFYLTQGNEQQAKEFAEQRARKAKMPRKEVLEMLDLDESGFLKLRKKIKPALISFRIKDHQKWESLKHKTFSSENLNWKEYICKWRNIYNVTDEFDSTFGPVADGGYGSGYAYKIKAYKDYNQLAVHTQEAADLFEIINLEVIE